LAALFNIELHYFQSLHLSQIFEGFDRLKKIGIIDLTIKNAEGDKFKPILTVIVNGRFKIIYDTLDGLNWIKGSREDNLFYFRNNFRADYYFKRSFNQEVEGNAPTGCKVFPLGLNYFIQSGLQGEISGNVIRSTDFEYPPILSAEPRVLFITRLWNPDDTDQEHLKEERIRLNQTRIVCIRACMKTFGKRFLGGLVQDKFSEAQAPDLILPKELTQKEKYVSNLHDHDICVATTGLHNSTGWKFAEYVASSRAIVSEPLHYEVPGNLVPNKNYLEFRNEEYLLSAIEYLITNPDKLQDMMRCNHQYYNDYLQPEKLVLNTLKQVKL